MTQMNLMSVPVASDVVYTPDAVARDIVDYFKPSGRILEPAAGDGAFLRHLPANTEWCEIERGRDFFQWLEPVDWIISNPPYSVFAEFLRHSFTIAANIVYLIPINKPFNSHRIMADVYAWGGIKHCRVLGGGASLGFPIGFAVGALYFQRGYKGGMTVSFLKYRESVPAGGSQVMRVQRRSFDNQLPANGRAAQKSIVRKQTFNHET